MKLRRVWNGVSVRCTRHQRRATSATAKLRRPLRIDYSTHLIASHRYLEGVYRGIKNKQNFNTLIKNISHTNHYLIEQSPHMKGEGEVSRISRDTMHASVHINNNTMDDERRQSAPNTTKGYRKGDIPITESWEDLLCCTAK